jgi:hypothetical protein
MEPPPAPPPEGTKKLVLPSMGQQELDCLPLEEQGRNFLIEGAQEII